VVETELLLSDLEILGRQRLKVEKKAKAGDRGAAAALAVLLRAEEGLNRGTWARDLGLGPRELEQLQGVPLLTLKPCLFVANLSEPELSGGVHYTALQQQAAGRVHSDMEKGFIRVEVMSLDDLSRLGSSARVREEGRVQVEGRDYLVRDGDILLFRFQRST